MIVPRRLTIFLITIGWLSITLISISITGRNAHGFFLDAPAMDALKCEGIYRTEKRNENHSRNLKKDATPFIEATCIISGQTDRYGVEKKSMNPLLHDVTFYHIPISSVVDSLTSIDFWLNVPPETHFTGNHGASDSEVSIWLQPNSGEIDPKIDPSPDYIYKSRTDRFDPSQVVIQKFASFSLVIASILMIILFSTCAGLVFLDRFVFYTFIQNCFRLDKHISWNRTQKEIKRLCQFLFKILIVIALYVILNAGFLFLFHQYIVPLPTVIKIFSAFDIDPLVWERNIEVGMLGDIGEEYERWTEEQNFSPEMARFWQEFLWNNWYILIALMLYFGASFYLSVFKLSMSFFKLYKKGVIRRKYFYYSVDRSRWVKNNLGRVHQVCCDNSRDSIDKNSNIER